LRGRVFPRSRDLRLYERGRQIPEGLRKRQFVSANTVTLLTPTPFFDGFYAQDVPRSIVIYTQLVAALTALCDLLMGRR
jgi:hypothetical protein